MNFTNREKELLLSNAPVLSRIHLYDQDGSLLQVFNENDYLVDWDYEDFRYVPDQGFIGQFVERLLDGHLMNIPEDLSLDDKEIDVEIAVVDPLLQTQVYHNYGRFIITKVEQEDTTGSYKFESSDYAKKFNVAFKGDEVTYPCTALELLNHACNQAGVKLNSGKNLFDKDNANMLDNMYPDPTSNTLKGSTSVKTIYIPCKPNTTYTISKIASTRFSFAYTTELPALNVAFRGRVVEFTATELTLTTDNSANYLIAFIYNANTDTLTPQQILDSIQIEEGSTATSYEPYPQYSISYAVSEDGLEVGNYHFKDGDNYYNFTLSKDLKLFDSLMLVGDRIVQRKITDDYKVVETNIYYITSSSGTGTELEGNKVPYIDFTNNNFVIENNQFEEQDSCRNVVTSIAKLSYTWARINEDNVLKLDFSKKLEGDVDSYDEIDTDKYYEATVTGNEVEPVNKVLIGMSNVDGENIVNDFPADKITLDNMNGNTNQEGTPTPTTPQDIHSVSGNNSVVVEGKNLFDINKWYNYNSDHNWDAGVYRKWVITEDGSLVSDIPDRSDYYCFSPHQSQTPSQDQINLIKQCGTKVKPSTDYIISYITDTRNQVFAFYYDINGVYLSHTSSPQTDNTQISFNVTTPANCEYIFLRFDNESYATTPKAMRVNNIQLEKVYNLFNKRKYVDVNGTISAGSTFSGGGANYAAVIPCEPNTSYVVKKRNDGDTNRFALAYSETIPDSTPSVSTSTGGNVRDDNGNSISITTSNNAKYLIIQYYRSAETVLTKQQLLDSIVVNYQNITPSEYEPYKSQSYEIDLPVENLFDKNNINELRGSIEVNTLRFTYSSTSMNYCFYIPCKSNTTYTIQKRNDGDTNRFKFASCSTEISTQESGVTELTSRVSNDNASSITITTGANDIYLLAQYYRSAETTLTKQQLLDSIMIEEGSKANAYMPYGLIPIQTNENLFDKNNPNVVNAYISTGKVITTQSADRTIYIPCLPNTTYTISKLKLSEPQSTNRFRVCTYDTIPADGVTGIDYVGYSSGTTADTITINTSSTARYLAVYCYMSTGATVTFQEILDNLYIEYGSVATYQIHDIKLNNINDIKDKIFKTSGKNILNKYNIISNNRNDVAQLNTGIRLTCKTAGSARWSQIPLENPDELLGKTITFSADLKYSGTNDAQIILFFMNGNSAVTGITGGVYGTSSTLSGTSIIPNEYPSGTNSISLLIYSSRSSTTVGEWIEYTNLQVQLGDVVTEYEPYSNGEWYWYRPIGKTIINEKSIITRGNTSTTGKYRFNVDIGTDIYSTDSTSTIAPIYSDKFVPTSRSATNALVQGIAPTNTGFDYKSFNLYANNISEMSVANATTWFGENPALVYYLYATPKYYKITYQPLIAQLNAIDENAKTYDGITHVTSRGVEIDSPIDITITDIDGNETQYSDTDIDMIGTHEYSDSSINIYDNPLTHSEALRRIAINGSEKLFGIRYTPMEVNSIGHPWLNGNEFMKVTNLEEQDLYFYPFDRKMTYKGYLETNLSAQSKNEVAQKYENKNTIIDRVHHTEIDVDKANGQISLISTQTDENTSDISNLIVTTTGISTNVETIQNTTIPTITGDIDTINNNITNMNSEINDINNNQLTSIVSRLSQVEQTAEAITNMFQITGGINTIRNSAFLLSDAVWEFTNNGTNPYYTPLGSSYNVALSGSTTSVAEIKLRSVKVKSKSENITNLKIGTKYTFNFYHKQDNNMTTTIKMYSTENNSSKAFNDITISGQQSFKNYEVSFTPTTYSNYTLEIIVSSTASVGYSYIYDLMLNAGDKQSWQPASDEIYSTTLTMSRLGLQVYSVGDGTITVLGSDGLASYETTDGRTRGRLVSQRTVDGDITRSNTTQSVYLTSDILNESASKWIETIIILNGRPSKVEYLESGQ